VFPEAGIYRVELTGRPLEAGGFQAFSVPFDVRVEPNEGSNTIGSGLIARYWPVWSVLVIALAAFAFVMFRRKPKAKS
jgi:hypothetical protein